MIQRTKKSYVDLFNPWLEINTIFYNVDSINRNLLNKVRKSYYAKDKILVNLYSELEDKDSLYIDKYNQITPPAYMPCVEQ